ncbi:FecR family protein [Carboxylicivirga sp. RSCT41]|uniref:FecR family protein n=1 Tax=Carboxylicivirga agarovorans TaxID=3417570 RepID=UPI003D3442EE
MKNIEWRILSRSITGNITSDESELLDAWLNYSQDNVVYYRQLKEFFTKNKRADIDMSERRYLFLKRVEANRKQLSRKHAMNLFMRYAAVVIVTLVSSVLVLKHINQPAEEIIIAAVSNEEVTLISNPGKTYDLSKEEDVNLVVSNELVSASKSEVDYSKEILQDKSASVEYHTLRVPIGKKFTLILADGSKVYLNSQSELYYPNQFSDSEVRKVNLKGEAYFEVAHNKHSPFIVVADGIEIKNYGTSYNVYNRSFSNQIITTLVEGSISVRISDGGYEHFVKPNEHATYNKDKQSFNVAVANVEQATAWKEGLFVFKDERLEKILQELSLEYNIGFSVTDKAILEQRFTSYIPRFDDFNDVLAIIENTGEIHFDVRERHVGISRIK